MDYHISLQLTDCSSCD